MSTTTIITDLEGLFKAGAKPTEEDFKKLINAYLVKQDNKVGIGTDEPKNNLDVKGKAVIGTGFGGTENAPPNGLIVEGNVGIGHKFADDALHVNGNIRLETGGLIIGGSQVINEAGVWQGKFPVQDDDDDDGNQAESGHWTDGDDQVSTTVKVGIGETTPTAALHVRGDAQIDEGQLSVSGLVNKKQVAFTAHGYNKVDSLDKSRICFQNTLDQPQPAVDIFNDSIFQPDAAHAGMYFLTVSITMAEKAAAQEVEDDSAEPDESPEESVETGDGEPTNDAEISFSLDAGQTPLLVIWRSGACLHASASLVHHFDGNTALTLHSSPQEVELDIDQIIITGYRL
ncbi:MAG: hypothetical protein Roseis2KO_44390 [Roseivirga sp.]